MIAHHLDHDREDTLLDAGSNESLGHHPWDKLHPVVLDLTAATDLGYTPVGQYAAAVPDEIDWLVATARASGGTTLPPDHDDTFFRQMFDYTREDSYLASHPR